MKRLIIGDTNSGFTAIHNSKVHGDISLSEFRQIIFRKLSEYEDTNKTPAEIEQLQKENAELKARLEKSVELPCKAGDTVYVDKKTLCDWYTFGEYKNYVKSEVIGIKITKKQKLVNLKPITERTSCTRYHEFYPFSSFGKTVFLTRKEAEQALKEREINA